MASPMKVREFYFLGSTDRFGALISCFLVCLHRTDGSFGLVWEAITKTRERQVLKDFTEEHPLMRDAASLPVRRAVSLLYYYREKARDVWLVTRNSKVMREAALWQIQAFDGSEFERHFARYDSFVKDRLQYQLSEMAIWHPDGTIKQK